MAVPCGVAEAAATKTPRELHGAEVQLLSASFVEAGGQRLPAKSWAVLYALLPEGAPFLCLTTSLSFTFGREEVRKNFTCAPTRVPFIIEKPHFSSKSGGRVHGLLYD